jgi:hypothetical protein
MQRAEKPLGRIKAFEERSKGWRIGTMRQPFFMCVDRRSRREPRLESV